MDDPRKKTLDETICRAIALGLKIDDMSQSLGFNSLEIALACHWIARHSFEQNPPLEKLAETLEREYQEFRGKGGAIVADALASSEAGVGLAPGAKP